MTEKELLYVEDVLEQAKQLDEISTYYTDEVEEECGELLNEVATVSSKQFKRIYNLL